MSAVYCIVRVSDGEVVGASAQGYADAINDAGARMVNLIAARHAIALQPDPSRDWNGFEHDGYRLETRPTPALPAVSKAMVEAAARVLCDCLAKDKHLRNAMGEPLVAQYDEYGDSGQVVMRHYAHIILTAALNACGDRGEG
jgi:hypothetical protein